MDFEKEKQTMQNLTNTLARLAIRKQVAETDDPLLVCTLRKEEPELQPGIKVSAYAEPEGDHYNAYLIYSGTHNDCSLYKKCIRKGCRSKTRALLVAEYSKNAACINCPLYQHQPERQLNLN